MADPLSLSDLGQETTKQEETGTKPKGLSLSELGNPAPKFRAIETQQGLVDVNSVLQSYDRPLVKEDFLEDQRLQEIVYQYL